MGTHDCINFIINFINSKYGQLFNSKFKKIHVYNFCKLMCNNSIDDDNIKIIVDNTIDYLVENNYIIKFKQAYMTRKIIDNSVNLSIDFLSSDNFKLGVKKNS